MIRDHLTTALSSTSPPINEPSSPLSDLLTLSDSYLVLVVFTAKWAGSVFLFVDYLEQVAGSMEGEVRMKIIDVDDFPEVSQNFGITRIPTTIFIRRREVVDIAQGATSRAKMILRIKNVLQAAKSRDSRH